ncbi:MAG: restriction endonuclease subunit S [Crinalium sp.]
MDKLITKKRYLKTATIQQLLTGKKRLPGFGEGKSYQQTEVGVIPEDWLTLKIGDLFDFKNGLNKSKKFFGAGTPIINYMDVFNYPGLYKSDVLGKVTVSADEIRAYGVRQGDVFFTRTSETVEEIGIAAVLLEDIDDGVFSGFVLRARPKSPSLDLDLLFKKYCFDSEIVRKQITSTSSYTTRALTNGRLLSQVLLPSPSKLEEQRDIAIVLSDIDAEITALEARYAKTQFIKQGMMQKIFTNTQLV